ncbi:MAG: ammonium transporter [Schleiferiaceae bacterium]|nr:ammonium transporter [Schleiferiaceae bacterium]
MKNFYNLKLKWKIAILVISAIGIGSLFVQYDTTPLEIFGSEDDLVAADVAWLLTASCLVLLMTPGLSFFYGGMVGKKNIISTMLQSFVALGVISILWMVVGFGLAFGDPVGFFIGDTYYGVIGNPMSFLYFNQVGVLPHSEIASTIPFILFALFQLKFAIITPAIITGSFAERVRFVAYLMFMVLFSLLIYTPLCHMIWHPNGLLGGFFGIVDFAGGTVVHMSAGFAALAGALYLGKRKERHHQPTNIPFVILGTGMLWFGWFGFNAGSSLAADGSATLAFATTTGASAMAMMTWLFLDKINGRKLSALGACMGAVVGLVAITPAAGFVTVSESLFFGFVAAIVSNYLANWQRLKQLDDTLDVFACHGVGGVMGMLLTAVFAREEGASLLHGGGWSVFFSHMGVLLLVSVFTFFGSLLLYGLVNRFISFRVDPEKEELGLDISQHGES